MLSQLQAASVDAFRCSFKMVAVGPIYPEQLDMSAHKVYRDKVASLERGVADHLRVKGLKVLGIHHSKAVGDQEHLAMILAELDTLLGTSL